jgi:hypothetical protein
MYIEAPCKTRGLIAEAVVAAAVAACLLLASAAFILIEISRQE